jgi:hypothetical protein
VLGGIRQEYRHLRVLDAPRGAGVLALHADRVVTRFQIPGVVQDQHRARVTQLVDHVLPYVVADLVGVPDRLAQ